MTDGKCSSCETDVPAESQFCLKCGTPIAGASSTKASDPLLTGLEDTVGDSHEVIRLLGRGGMGAVYLARERALDRLVAIKVLPPEVMDADSVERFRREARTAAKLTHPNIVPLHTFGEANGMMYFVMGFVQGESLGSRLKRQGGLGSEETRRILAETAGALHYAHARGVVHRDIKPDNILIDDETGKPMLTDFGVAKSVASGETLTQLGTALGTPHYMSPEQAAGEKDIDGRSDLYSLGVVGYQMVSGRLPFDGESVREVMVQQVTKEPTPLKAVVPDAPADLTGLITRCMAKEPDDRLPDGKALETFLGISTDEEERIPEELQVWVRNFRVLPWLMGGALYISYSFAIWGHGVGTLGFAVISALGLLPLADSRRQFKLQNHSWRTMFSHGLRKPKWWPFWWPGKFRGPGDLWNRFPRVVRRSKLTFLLSFGAIVLAAPLFLRAGLGTVSVAWIEFMDVIWVGIAVPVAAGISMSFVQLYRWGKRNGLTSGDVEELAFASDRHPIWKKPVLQSLLKPEVADSRTGSLAAPDTPDEYVQALTDAARDLEGPARSVAIEATAAGRELMNTIQTVDVQITNLAKDADPAERERLEEKAKEFGESAEAESEARRRMRELLEEQLNLANSLARQLDAATERRAHLVGLLKTLWMQIASLRAHHHEASFDSSEISGKIRAISEDARRFTEASEETKRLLDGGQ